MWTVLKGETIPDMKLYFAKNGTKGEIVRTNPVAVEEWFQKLKSLIGNTHMDEPIKYISRMIDKDPTKRPNMDEIVLETSGSDQTSRFCCSDCMEDWRTSGNFHFEIVKRKDETMGALSLRYENLY